MEYKEQALLKPQFDSIFGYELQKGEIELSEQFPMYQGTIEGYTQYVIDKVRIIMGDVQYHIMTRTHYKGIELDLAREKLKRLCQQLNFYELRSQLTDEIEAPIEERKKIIQEKIVNGDMEFEEISPYFSFVHYREKLMLIHELIRLGNYKNAIKLGKYLRNLYHIPDNLYCTAQLHEAIAYLALGKAKKTLKICKKVDERNKNEKWVDVYLHSQFIQFLATKVFDGTQNEDAIINVDFTNPRKPIHIQTKEKMLAIMKG